MNSSNKEYQAALDYIYSFVDYSRTRQDTLKPEDFDLSRMWSFMDILGSPQNEYPSIHIAGTKGKGSVGAFCANAYQAGGYKVGFYTSPHLKDFEERIQVNGESIPRDTLADYVDEIQPAVDAIPGLTSFEIMTGLAYLYFARTEVDIAVIEVGLGGRFDATNVITPLVSVITSLYLDHVSILGDTLEQIAAVKGGIIKPGVPVVSAPQRIEPLQVLQEIAAENKSTLIPVDQKYTYKILAKSLDGQDFSLTVNQKTKPIQFRIPLIGDYQVTNAVTAYEVLETLQSKGFPLAEEAIREGFLTVDWPARLEVLRKNPPVIVDSAHNPASIEKLQETVDDYFPGVPLILVFGVSEDKQLGDMLEAILPRTLYFIATQSDHPRAMEADSLELLAKQYACSTESIPEVAHALDRALSLAGNDKLVVVTGSIFVAASARIAWFEMKLEE